MGGSMKHLILAATLTLIGSQAVYAYDYIISQGTMADTYLDKKTGKITYFDYRDHKRKTVEPSDIAKEVKKGGLDGIKQGDHVLYNQQNVNFCAVFHVFENGMAYVGCQNTAKGMGNLGLPRPEQLRGFVSTKELTAEVPAMDGFKKGETVTLLKDSGNLKCGSTVVIEAIHTNGEALVQKKGAAYFLDTSGLHLKYNIERVPLADLAKKD